MSAIDYRYLSTVPGILKIICLILNILAITCVRSAENPYYAVKSVIKFDSIAIAAFCFTAITLLLSICNVNIQNSLKWLRNELLILCALIIVYIYGIVSMVHETVDCHNVIESGCPRQLTATVAGIAAVLVYFVDGIFKLKDYRQRIQAARIASTGDDNIEADDGDIDEETIRNTNRNGDVDVPINT